jgi:hypothetical protein
MDRVSLMPIQEEMAEQPHQAAASDLPFAATSGRGKKKPESSLGVTRSIPAFRVARDAGVEGPLSNEETWSYASADLEIFGVSRVSSAASGGGSSQFSVTCDSPQVAIPEPTPDIFIAAGAIAAERAARGGGSRSRVEEILRRAVDQAAALRGEAA